MDTSTSCSGRLGVMLMSANVSRRAKASGRFPASRISHIQDRQSKIACRFAIASSVLLMLIAIENTKSPPVTFPSRYSIRAYALYSRKHDDRFLIRVLANFLADFGNTSSSNARRYSPRSLPPIPLSTKNLNVFCTHGGSRNPSLGPRQNLLTAKALDLAQSSRMGKTKISCFHYS